jgi:hypothetical protein
MTLILWMFELGCQWFMTLTLLSAERATELNLTDG